MDTVYEYDILDKRIKVVEEVVNGGSEFLHTRYRYDANGNQVLVIYPEGNADDASVFDERDLLFQHTRGATSPPAEALLAPGDPLTTTCGAGYLPPPIVYRPPLANC